MKKIKAAHGKSSCPLAILGGGNMGASIARGLVAAGYCRPQDILITRRQAGALEALAKEGFSVLTDNREAVRRARIVVLAVRPQHSAGLLREIALDMAKTQPLLISVVTGISVAEILALLGKSAEVVRAMPNIAVEIRESMTCLAAPTASQESVRLARSLFDALGTTLVIEEELMLPATALCACGLAFFLRSIRAASQGGIQIGFHSDDALVMAAQTARGAASLLLKSKSHPEGEIDKVTTPSGCTIAGLNEMEHHGFSSAMIMGIVTSAEKAAVLFNKKK
ncbi:MAG: pyrroline-5-carboxylate reductase [Elusimicrobiota bacterium]|jgi:pyrroline-5-carboxylate reductase